MLPIDPRLVGRFPLCGVTFEFCLLKLPTSGVLGIFGLDPNAWLYSGFSAWFDPDDF